MRSEEVHTSKNGSFRFPGLICLEGDLGLGEFWGGWYARPSPASGAPCQHSSASKRSGGGAMQKAATVAKTAHDVDGLGDKGSATEWENVLKRLNCNTVL